MFVNGYKNCIKEFICMPIVNYYISMHHGKKFTIMNII
jgi:hypothetical protein